MKLRACIAACGLVVALAVSAFGQCGANGTASCGAPRQSAAVPPPNFAPAVDSQNVGPVLPPVNPAPFVAAPQFAIAPQFAANGTSASASASTGGGGAAVGFAPAAVGFQTYQAPVTTMQTYSVPTTSYQTYQMPVTTMQTYQVQAPVATEVAVQTPLASVGVAAIPTNVAIPATAVAAGGCSNGSCNKGLLGGRSRSRSRSRSSSVAVTRS